MSAAGQPVRLTSQIYNLPEVGGKRPCPPSLLAQHTDGLLCLTGGARSALYHLANTRQDAQAQGWLSHLADLFPNRLYVELQLMNSRDSAAASRLVELAAEMALPLAASHDIYMLTPDGADIAAHTHCRPPERHPLRCRRHSRLPVRTSSPAGAGAAFCCRLPQALAAQTRSSACLAGAGWHTSPSELPRRGALDVSPQGVQAPPSSMGRYATINQRLERELGGSVR